MLSTRQVMLPLLCCSRFLFPRINMRGINASKGKPINKNGSGKCRNCWHQSSSESPLRNSICPLKKISTFPALTQTRRLSEWESFGPATILQMHLMENNLLQSTHFDTDAEWANEKNKSSKTSDWEAHYLFYVIVYVQTKCYHFKSGV